MPSPRQLAAIMFTDIVGYTALMQRNEEQAVATTRRYLLVLRQVAKEYNGTILNDYGDGSLCIFTSAVDAVKGAANMQRLLQQEPVVPLRIGLHIGEIFFEEGKVFGDGVNIASRIQSLGIGGSVLLSKDLYETIKSYTEFEAVSLGTFEFKNVEMPAEVFALEGEGLVVPRREQLEGKLKAQHPDVPKKRNAWKWLTAAVLLTLVTFFIAKKLLVPVDAAYGAPREANSIAVLYFSNMSGDPEQEYFSDGITEEIITRLSMIDGLRVKSRTSVLQYKGKAKSVKQIAKELGVRTILEGSVRKQGSQLRVTAQLIDATNDVYIWAENYDRELKDVFSVQSDIAQNIAQRFQITLTADTRKKLQAPLTQNTEAYDLFLQARGMVYGEYGLGGQTDRRLEAMALLRKALTLDPSFAEAYALFSAACSLMSRDAANPQQWIDSALLLATKAVEYAPARPEGYTALATVYENTGDIAQALQWALKANDVQPMSMASYIADLYARNGQYGKAVEWTAKGIRHDPAEPGYYLTKSLLFYNVGLLDSARKYIDVATHLRPEGTGTTWAQTIYYRITRNRAAYESLMQEIFRDQESYNYNMAMFYLFSRQWRTADSFYRYSDHPDDIDAALTRQHLGDTATARRYFERALKVRLAAAGTWDHWRYYDVARIYAALGDERYDDYFRKAVRAGWHEYPFFQRDPFFDGVRSTPTFRKLAELMYQRNEKFKADLLRGL